MCASRSAHAVRPRCAHARSKRHCEARGRTRDTSPMPPRVWKLVTDVPAAARCVPGVAAVTPSGTGKYKGSLLVQLGPVRLVLDGDVALTATDEAAGKASVRADAKDSRLGGTVRATMDLTLVDKGEDTELRITSDV